MKKIKKIFCLEKKISKGAQTKIMDLQQLRNQYIVNYPQEHRETFIAYACKKLKDFDKMDNIVIKEKHEKNNNDEFIEFINVLDLEQLEIIGW